VEFARLERLPVDSASVDAVTSNCVINLVPDKAAVFREIGRVLKPGGRMVISDIILDGPLPESIEKDVYAYVGCISGAMQRGDYFEALEAAGLRDVELLKDVDYLGAMMQAAPEDTAALLARNGVAAEDVLGKVRSVTFALAGGTPLRALRPDLLRLTRRPRPRRRGSVHLGPVLPEPRLRHQRHLEPQRALHDGAHQAPWPRPPRVRHLQQQLVGICRMRRGHLPLPQLVAQVDHGLLMRSAAEP
jgi:SAM-dependent methyltransferase